MKWVEFFTYKIKISQQEFGLTNAQMRDLLTPSNCIISPPFTPSSSPFTTNETVLTQGERSGGGGRRFFWLNAAFANIKDYIVSTGVKYRHEMHQFNTPYIQTHAWLDLQ